LTEKLGEYEGTNRKPLSFIPGESCNPPILTVGSLREKLKPGIKNFVILATFLEEIKGVRIQDTGASR
jgi:hypothetical protein